MGPWGETGRPPSVATRQPVGDRKQELCPLQSKQDKFGLVGAKPPVIQLLMVFTVGSSRVCVCVCV